MKRSSRRGASEWAGLVKRYSASELTQRAFAERNGVPISSLQYWLRKSRAKDGGGEAAAEQLRFVEVIGAEKESVPAGGVSMELEGLTLRFETLPSPSYLASVAAAFATE